MPAVRISISIILFFLCCLVSTVSTRAVTCLEISGGEPERVLMSIPVEDRAIICLEFVNSIYLAPVKETFIYESGPGISIIGVESPSAGVFEYYRLTPDVPGKAHLYRHVGNNILLRSSDYRHHTLTIGNKAIQLKRFAKDGELLMVRVKDARICEADE